MLKEKLDHIQKNLKVKFNFHLAVITLLQVSMPKTPITDLDSCENQFPTKHNLE